jgi:hypothetical protein
VVGFAIIANFSCTVMRHLKFLRNLWLAVCYVDVKIITYRNVISTVVLYGCVTWSLISKEQRGLMVFVNEVQGKILGLQGKKQQDTGGDSFFEEPHHLCCLQDITLTTSCTTRYAKREIRTGYWKNAYRVLVRKLK